MLLLPNIPNSSDFGEFPDGGNWRTSKTGASDRLLIEVDEDAEGKYLHSQVISDGTVDTYRAEIAGSNSMSPNLSNRGYVDGVERWVGFTVELDPETQSTLSFTSVICQIIQTSGSWAGNGFAGPILALAQRQGRYVFSQAWDSNLDSTSLDVINHITDVDVGACFTEGRDRFNLHFMLNSVGAGITELYLNRRLVYRNLTDPNSYNQSGATGGLKFGTYVPSWRSAPPAAGVKVGWKHRDIVIGDSAESLESMNAGYSAKAPGYVIIR